jgi:hypothetical protein
MKISWSLLHSEFLSLEMKGRSRINTAVIFSFFKEVGVLVTRLSCCDFVIVLHVLIIKTRNYK